MTVIIRAMTSHDLPQVFRVRTSTVENAISLERLSAYGITIESMADALQSHTKGWVCEIGQQIVGFCMGDGVNAEMQVLAVLPDHEGLGIAKSLMHKVQIWLFEQGHEQLWLLTTADPQLRAYGFYQHLGWHATGQFIDGEEKFTLTKNY